MKTLSSAAALLVRVSLMVRNIFTTSPPVDPSMNRLKNIPIMKSCHVRNQLILMFCTARSTFQRTVATSVQAKNTATPTPSHHQSASFNAAPISRRASGS